MSLITFNEAIQIAESSGGNKHLLLGNGFSIACRPDIFSYKALFENSQESLPESVKTIFEKLKTTDFEVVIKILLDSIVVLDSYLVGNEKQTQIKSDIEVLKNKLIEVLCTSHLSYPAELKDYQYETCASFLSNFTNIYTLNYDLLLYWTLMYDKAKKVLITKIDDGFRTDEDDISSIIWESGNVDGQNIYYLHGALHLFDTGPELIKVTWKETGITLINQITEALASNHFPLIVVEGSSSNKLTKVRHSDYLSKGIRSFRKIGGSLFIHGHSLADNDDHFLQLIPKSKITNLFVSLHGDVNSDDNKKLIKKVNSFVAKRLEKKQKVLNVYFYDAKSIDIWANKSEEVKN